MGGLTLQNTELPGKSLRLPKRLSADSDPKHKRLAMIAIFATILSNLVGFGIIFPLFPIYAEKMGANAFQIGLLFSAYSITQILVSPLLGRWADQYGRRPVLIVSLIGSVISFVMMAKAQSYTMLLIARAIDGLTGGNILVARAYLTDILRGPERTKGFGLLGAAFSIGFILGPALGGVLAPISVEAPFWAAAALAGVATLFALFWTPETLPFLDGTSTHSAPPRTQWWHFFKRQPVGFYLILTFVLWLFLSIYHTSFSLYAFRRHHLSASQVSFFLCMASLWGVIIQVRGVSKAVALWGDRGTLLRGLAFIAVGFFMISVSPSPLWLAISLLPTATGASLITPAISGLLAASVSDREQGALQGITGSCESLARIIAPILGNMLVAWRTGASFAFSSVLALGTLVIVRILTSQRSELELTLKG